MAKLSVPPTKSSLLALKRQLAFTKEGYDLLEQKRQILVLELMNRLNSIREAERKVRETLQRAYAALRQAVLDIGSAAVDQAALGVGLDHQVELDQQPLMGLRIPRAKAQIEPAGVQFGLAGTSASTDLAMLRFVEVLPLLAELAGLENAVLRLAREVQKTQRRCNALSKIFIPDYQETIAYISATLEERERESFVILKMIRDRMKRAAPGGPA